MNNILNTPEKLDTAGTSFHESLLHVTYQEKKN